MVRIQWLRHLSSDVILSTHNALLLIYHAGSKHYEQINLLSSYVDATSVYGANDEEAKYLRTYLYGLLKYQNRSGEEYLPEDPPGVRMCMIPPQATKKSCYYAGKLLNFYVRIQYDTH